MDLSIKGLKKHYEGKSVLDINQLHISKGTFLGIIGPNGAGKSTLVKILSNIEDATSGEISYNGESFSNNLLKDMTLVFQKPYLLRTTVYNNIAYPLQLRKLDQAEIDNRVISMMKTMEIMELKDQKAWTLSGGEAQKVALARALIFRPSLLILDEFTANIDPSSMVLLENTIKQFHEGYRPTIIMVTHNIQQAKRLCSHVAFMINGKIVEYGEMNEVIFNSQNTDTQKFISGEILI